MRSRSRSCFRARSCHAISQNPQDYTVLSRVSGTAYRGTERISSNRLLDFLEVGPGPITRQKVAKRAVEPIKGPATCLNRISGTAS
jgi:hypothetical protein